MLRRKPKIHIRKNILSIMDLESNNNGVYSLNYHLIFVTKYRRKVLTEEKLPLLDTLIFKVA